MEFFKKITQGFSIIACLLLVGCSGSGGSGSGGSGGGQGYTYSTTSNLGDYAEWTYTGSTLTAKWTIVDAVGLASGVISVSASCGAKDAIFGYRTCTVSSTSCLSGVCPTVSGSFNMMEVPGIALFVQTGTGTSAQLHTGFLLDRNGCSANVAGDYTFIRTSVGNEEIFGLYRSDSTFNNVVHADFGFDASGVQSTTPTVEYKTGVPSGSETLSGSVCTDGVRTRTISGATVRSMMTSSGVFILDLPSGQGGLVSFKTSNAATLSDISNKTFRGVSFPDNSTPQAVMITTGASNGTEVTITSGSSTDTPGSYGITGGTVRPFSNTSNVATSPAYPDFTSSVTNYNTNLLQPTYSQPSAIPGMFRIEGTYSDTGRVLVAFAKIGGKVLGFGAVYNYRSAGASLPNGSTYGANGRYNTGNFILFED